MNASAIPGRIDRARFEVATWPDTISLPVRFDDLDVLWHVNNAAAVIMLQEARVMFGINLALPKIEDFGVRSVVAGQTIEYAAEITFPGAVEIRSGILALGRTSFTFAQQIRKDGVGCVFATVTLVCTGEQGTAALPEGWRNVYEERALLR